MIPAIIPARGGSKAIPRKNMQQVGGKTLIARAIRCCNQADCIGSVYVSTEDKEIAEEASKYGATVLPRPRRLARDETLSSDVLLYHLHAISCETFAFVQCTAPLMRPYEIDETYKELIKSEADVAVAVAPIDAIVIRRDDADGVLPGLQTRRQDREQMYAIAGSVWVLHTKPFWERQMIYSDRVATCECVHHRLEIDTPDDLELARLMVRSKARSCYMSYVPD